MDKLNELQIRLWGNAFTLEMRYGFPCKGEWQCNVFTEANHTLVYSTTAEYVDDLIDEVIVEFNRKGYD